MALKTEITATDLTRLRSETLLLPMAQEMQSEAYKTINTKTDGLLESIVEQEKFTAKHQLNLVIYTGKSPYRRIILAGMGKMNEMTITRFINFAQSCAKQTLSTQARTVVACCDGITVKDADQAWIFRCMALAFQNACYRYNVTFGKKPQAKSLQVLKLHATNVTPALQQALQQADAVHRGMTVARDLGNLPGNICTPAYLAQQARKLAQRSSKIHVKVLEESTMRRLKMGAFLSVSRGSHHPGKLVCIEYRNAPVRQPPVALIGKGITFDTGGISIKPSSTMDEMKFDMSGAGSVIGVITSCIQMKLPLNIIGILACAENMPGGNASKPGDIVTTMSGQTVEILNTDAEGRLVLCDALTYVQRYNPEYVIDIATLTGACVVALGQVPAGLMSNDQDLARQLLDAGEKSGDRVWQLPIWEDYQKQLDSNFADMANIGGRWAGAITAGCFLSRFTKKYRWAHLDIAGVAWHTGKSKGSTGRPVPLLVEFLLQNANL